MSQRWSEEDLPKLGDLDERDWERSESVSPPKAPRFTVAVTFKKESFAEMASQAERMGKEVTEFIRRRHWLGPREPIRWNRGAAKKRTSRSPRQFRRASNDYRGAAGSPTQPRGKAMITS